LLKDNIPVNVRFWLSNLNDEGIWLPNFSRGIDTAEVRNATKNWKGYMAVKRVEIIKTLGLLEEYRTEQKQAISTV
jgi:hypothetical protein